MKTDNYNEIINYEEYYMLIANHLYSNIGVERAIIIGWTDGKIYRRDILFTFRPLMPNKDDLQRGMRWCELYVSIIDFTSYGFVIEMNTDNTKDNGYLMEKLHLHNNSCDIAICNLINGVIHCIDMLREGKNEENK